MLLDYAAVGGLEAWNNGRLQAYLTNVGSPFTTGPDICSCDSITPEVLGLGITEYQTPILDPAPWYDPDYFHSREFLGFMPLSVSGVDDNPRARSVTNAVGGGGVFGPVRVQPRTMTVQGVIIGTSCCGAEYGLQYLTELLSACTGNACDGDCMTMYNCCPDPAESPAVTNAAHRRTFRRTALVSGPTVVQRNGTGQCAAGSCAGGGDLITVEFVLVAATPWAWTDAVPLLDVDWPAAGTGDCVEWCFPSATDDDCILWDLSGEGACTGLWTLDAGFWCMDVVTADACPGELCLHADCVAAVDACSDPLRPVVAPPQPSAPEAPFCVPLAPERAFYSIDLSTRPTWSTDVPIMTISAGSTALRNVRITFFEKITGTTLTCEQIADANVCAPAADYYVTFVPAGGTVTIDGQTGRAVTDCAGECRSASTVFGSADGGPLVVAELDCAEYCVMLEADPIFPPAPDSSFGLSVSGRGY